jgi:recombination protein RecT
MTNPKAKSVTKSAAVKLHQEREMNLKTYLDDRRGEIAAALPGSLAGHLGPDRMLRLVLTEIRQRPKLAECSPASVFGGAVMAAQLGLRLGEFNSAWLIPYSTKKGMEAQLQIGYDGLRELVERSGKVSGMHACVVYEDDEWDLELAPPKLYHKPARPKQPKSAKEAAEILKSRREEIVAAYAVAEMNDGTRRFAWLWTYEIEHRRAASRAKDAGPWVTHYEQMAMKSAIRELCRNMPKSSELAAALTLEDRAEVGKSQNLSLDPALQIATEEPVVTPDEPLEKQEDEAAPPDEIVPEPPAPPPFEGEHVISMVKDRDGNETGGACACGETFQNADAADYHLTVVREGVPPEFQEGD